MRPAVALAFLRRDWAVARSYRLPFLLQLVSSLFVLVLVFYVGRLVDQVPRPETSDLSKGYFPYVVVGLAVLGVTQTALGSFTDRLREEQTTGTLEALLATPATPATVVLGSALYLLLQAVAQALLLLAVAVAIGLRPALAPEAVVGSVLAGVGLVGLFAAVGVLVAAFTIVVKRGSALAGLVTSVLSLLGGVFFPVSLLPSAVGAVSRVLPFTWGLEALRRSLLLGDVQVLRIAGLLVLSAVLLPLAVRVFSRSVDRARRDGSLTQY